MRDFRELHETGAGLLHLLGRGGSGGAFCGERLCKRVRDAHAPARAPLVAAGLTDATF